MTDLLALAVVRLVYGALWAYGAIMPAKPQRQPGPPGPCRKHFFGPNPEGKPCPKCGALSWFVPGPSEGVRP